jgi:methionyl-tRNA formyltransferase
LVAQELIKQSESDLIAVYIRKLWSLKRVRTDLRREGPRLLQKIYSKLIIGEQRQVGEVKSPLAVYARERGLEARDLPGLALQHDIACQTVNDFNDHHCVQSLSTLEPDLIVFTGGGLIREQIIKIPRLGVLNCHSGLLPQYRGMDTLEWALLESQGDLPEVGLTLHVMDKGVDTGPILRQHVESLHPGDTLEGIRARLEPEMVRLMSQGVYDLAQGTLRAEPQDPGSGRQYFVIHPRLRERAASRLAGSVT